MLEERKCPNCGELYLPPAERCLRDNQPLATTNTLVGCVLDRRYRVDKVLGVGGMGAVYRSTHLGFGKEFAVKVLHPEMMEREDMFERFRNEARAAGLIEHNKAVKVTDFGVSDGRLAFLVMDLVEGIMLRTLVEKTRLEIGRTVDLLSQVCEAIQAAHQKNIIHRDLKPDNIIVQQIEGKEQVKVLDFGIAKLRESDQEGGPKGLQTKVGMLVGTPQYMSPEQCKGMRGEELKPTSDIYSLGIIAYEMFAGRLPFTESSTLGYLSKHSHEPPPPLRLFAPHLSLSLEQVVMQALEKNPAHRQQSALEFAQALQTALTAPTEDTVKRLHAQTEIGTTSVPTKQPRTPQAPISLATMMVEPSATPVTSAASPSRWAWSAVAIALLGLLSYGAYQRFHRTPQAPPIKEPPAPSQPQRVTDDYGTMLLIPGGTFEMGRDDGEVEEGPKHKITVTSFYLDETEVTNQQYKKFVEATGRQTPEHWKNNHSYLPEEALLPVTYVTWNDAMDYAQWAGKRLPTEEEWEYAARSGSSGWLFPWGNEWRAGNANAARAVPKLMAVKSLEKDQNIFGIFDLGGNVSEWVQSGFWRYGASSQIPVDRNCPDCKVYRGGNFNRTDLQELFSTVRRASLPALPEDSALAKQYRELVFPLVGFRCARDYAAAK